MKSTFATNIYCRPSKASKNGKAPLELCVIIDGKRSYIVLPHPKVNPSEFNKKRRSKELQDYVNAVSRNIIQVVNDMTEHSIPITTENFKKCFKNGGAVIYKVHNLFDDYIRLQRERVGVDLTQDAFRRYEMIRDMFYEYHSKDSDATSITPSVIQGFYIQLQHKYNTETSASYIARIKSIMKYGMDNGIFKINPCIGLRVRHKRHQIDFLTDEEITKIMDADIDNDCLNSVREAFLLQVFSGLSYIDLEHLTESDIREENGVYFIHKPRVKTGVPYTAIILPDGVEILRRNNWKMKVISNQKMNVYLKQVMTLSGISHPLVTHLGRKTYGHILLNGGKFLPNPVRMEVVSKCLGHSTTRTTAKYYTELSPQSVINEMAVALR